MVVLLRISKFIDGMSEWVGRALFLLMPVLVVIGALTALLRKTGEWTSTTIVTNAWLDIQYYIYGLIFLGLGAYNLRHDEHVRVDVIYERLSEKKQAVINLFGTVLFLLPVAFCLVWFTGRTARLSLGELSANAGGLPVWPIKIIVPIALGLLFLQGISQLIKAVLTLTGREEPTVQSTAEPTTEPS